MKYFLLAISMSLGVYGVCYPLSKIIKSRRSDIFDAIKKGDTPLCKTIILGPNDSVHLKRGGRTPLHWASAYGNETVCKILLVKGAVIDARGIDGETPLHDGCKEGHKEVCELLLKHRADVTTKDSVGKTALHGASSEGHVSVCNLLIEKNADTNSRDLGGSTPLHYASKEGRAAVCELLIESGAHVNAKNKEGITAFHWACSKIAAERENTEKNDATLIPLASAKLCNYPLVRRLLLKSGADYNAQDSAGRTPLHWASAEGHLSIGQLLLEKGAHIDVKDSEGMTPLHSASVRDNYAMCQVLIDANADVQAQDIKGNTPLHCASIQGSVLTCQKLLENHAFIEAKNFQGNTPFCSAFENKKSDACKLLLENGADIDAQNNYGQNVLHNVCKKGNMHACGLLLSENADIHAKNLLGQNALHIASKEGHLEVCQLLLNKGADIFSRDEILSTPLHSACIEGHLAVCELFLRWGAPINAKQKNGNSPLHCAYINRCSSILYLLVKNKADLNKTDRNGRTVLHRVCQDGETSLCELLVKKGANVNIQDLYGMTPLMFACERGHSAIVSLLLDHKNLFLGLKDKELEGTALHWACEHGRAVICKKLIRRGFDPDETANTLTPLHIAIKNSNWELIVLFFGIQENLNAQDKEGNSPLHFACSMGLTSTVELILFNKGKRHIDINLVTSVGKTPLHNAVDKKRDTIVQLLLTYGVKPNIADKYHKTPLMYAVEYQNVEICKLLKAKIPASDFSAVKKTLIPLIRKKRELEELFGLTYERVPTRGLNIFDDVTEEDSTIAQLDETGAVEGKLPVYELGHDGERVNSEALQDLFNLTEESSSPGRAGLFDDTCNKEVDSGDMAFTSADPEDSIGSTNDYSIHGNTRTTLQVSDQESTFSEEFSTIESGNQVSDETTEQRGSIKLVGE